MPEPTRNSILAVALAAVLAAVLMRPVSAAGPAFVDITWFSISNVYYEIGPLKIVTDGYITRIPQSAFFGGGGGLAKTHEALKPDLAGVTRVMNAWGGRSSVNLLLTGHSHFDHSFDTGTWSTLTGARIIGSKTTCLQALAQKVPADRCRAVIGREVIQLADGITMRVVRWNHSGSAAQNPEQHNPVELKTAPVPDPVTGGLHAGVAEDFPNGGGNRGYLFTVDGPQGRFSWFFQNSASVGDLQAPIVVDGVDYGAPLDNLKLAMKDAGLDSVDLWIGSGGRALTELMLPVLKPKAFLPVHFDGLYASFWDGLRQPYKDDATEQLLSAANVKLARPAQYMDKWRLDRAGVTPIENARVKQALGLKSE
jgi:L-ascorbate metabolism protein UlaG (beta-lactamase superfamily)